MMVEIFIGFENIKNQYYISQSNDRDYAIYNKSNFRYDETKTIIQCQEFEQLFALTIHLQRNHKSC